MDHPLLTQYQAEIRYLLDRMEPAERDPFGQRLIEDGEAFDRVREAETELYDAFARGDLPAGLRADFEKNLLQTPAQFRRLGAARAVARRTRSRPVPGWALAALAAGVLLGVALAPRLWRGGEGKASSIIRVKIDQTRSASARIPELPLPPLSAPVDVRISWNPAEPAGVYQAELQTDGKRVWSGQARVLPHDGNGLEAGFRLDAGVLRPGPYELTVTSGGGEAIGFGEFRVTGSGAR